MKTLCLNLGPALLTLALLLPFVSACSRGAYHNEVTLRMSADTTLHRMAGGLGASWHAIEDSIPCDGKTSHGGSGWGANPDPADSAAWQDIGRHAAWLGLDFLRVELEQRMYEPERGVYTWDSREMKILYRILDWCQANGADVFLQQMWSNADWMAYPEFRGDPIKRVHSAPVSLPDFAAGYAALINHLTKERGYTCIKWLSINNEPGWDWSWWQSPPNESAPFTPGLAAVRAALDSAGVLLPLSGPDWTDSPALEPEKIDFDQYIGAYDIHSYYSRFDFTEIPADKPNLPLSLVVQRLSDWAGWAHQRGKPFFLTELGSMIYGWGASDPGPNTWPASLKDAETVIRALNAGVDGINHWSFINRGDLDGQWQMVETWDRANGRLLDKVEPRANSYFLYGLLTRFCARHSDVLATRLESGQDSAGVTRVFAATLKAPDGNLTLALVNDSESDHAARIELNGLKEGIKLYRYQATPATADNPGLKIDPLEEIGVAQGGGRIELNLPASSLIIYSTRRLGHGDPGMIE